MQGLQVRSLVKELRSYMPCGVAKKKKKKKNPNQGIDIGTVKVGTKIPHIAPPALLLVL